MLVFFVVFALGLVVLAAVQMAREAKPEPPPRTWRDEKAERDREERQLVDQMLMESGLQKAPDAARRSAEDQAAENARLEKLERDMDLLRRNGQR